MRILPIIFLLFPLFVQAEKPKDCLILIHGMAKSSSDMEAIEAKAKSNGFHTWNKNYESTSKEIPLLAKEHISKGLDYCKSLDSDAIHFASHSLGGILIRQYLQENTIENLGRIVMLGPPNHGSEVADFLKDYYLYQVIMGPAGQSLGTAENDLPQRLSQIDGEIGIIAGNYSLDIWFATLFGDEPNDGKVSVKSTKLIEMADFLLVPNSHTFMMKDKIVIQQIIHFLNNGEFLE